MLGGIFEKHKIEDKIKSYNIKITQTNFWKNKLAAQKILKEKKFIQNILEDFKLVVNEISPKILSQIQQHYGYLRDSTKRMEPLSNPKNTNLFERRITNARIPF